jgi:branched-chain amino acid transport system permease protein
VVSLLIGLGSRRLPTGAPLEQCMVRLTVNLLLVAALASVPAWAENPGKAEYLGVSVRRYRLMAFLIAGAFGAVGGTLLAIPTGLADPLLAYWTHSGNLVFMMLLGGFSSFFGPLLGAFVFIFLKDQVMSLTEYWRFVFGAILAVIVVFFPHGLLGLVEGRRGARG